MPVADRPFDKRQQRAGIAVQQNADGLGSAEPHLPHQRLIRVIARFHLSAPAAPCLFAHRNEFVEEEMPRMTSATASTRRVASTIAQRFIAGSPREAIPSLVPEGRSKSVRSIVPPGLQERLVFLSFPAVNCRAIVECPSGTSKASCVRRFPGSELPGYCRMSLRDTGIRYLILYRKRSFCPRVA